MKKAEHFGSTSFMEGELDKRWNHFIPSVCLLAERLESLGLTYQNGEVTYLDYQEDSHA